MIKICGIKEATHALAAAESGADYIGMVFKAGSHRQVTIENASRIVHSIYANHYTSQTVGIFGNSPANEVNRAAEKCDLGWIQLSGNEPWEYCLKIERPTIKAIFVSPETTTHDVLKEIELGYRLLAGRRLICLLDTYIKGTYGGTGQSFDWKVAREVSEKYPVFIAGGLTSLNVSDLLEKAHPWGVDVSSGVETQGIKDEVKIKQFIHTVKLADRNNQICS